MRYADITVGMKVLAGRSRRGTKFWRLADLEMAEVLKVGVETTYTAWAGGWNGRTEHRHTSQGVWLRVQRHDRRTHRRDDDTLLDPEYETSMIAAYLIPAEGEDLARWQAARARDAEREAMFVFTQGVKDGLAQRFGALGIEVQFDQLNNVVLTVDQAKQLLRQAEASAS